MNFLAHLHLAGSADADLMMGNLGADFVKGRHLDHLPGRVPVGIMMHRKIDTFTDTHPVVYRSTRRLFSKWGRFSGILIDMAYDHFLSVEWGTYSEEELRAFLDRRYALMRERAGTLPEDLRGKLLGLIQSDRLASYGELEGIASALERISQRFVRKPVQLAPAVDDMRTHYEGIRSDFHEFYPVLMKFADELRASSSEFRPSL